MRLLTNLAILVALTGPAFSKAADTESQIKGVLNVQLEAWNRGDIPAMVETYAPDCIFVGKRMIHGRAEVLAHYQKVYPTRQAMGNLSFSGLAIRLLTSDVAIVTGEWHLQPSGASAEAKGGVFSLAFRREKDGWKIVLDHTS